MVLIKQQEKELEEKMVQMNMMNNDNVKDDKNNTTNSSMSFKSVEGSSTRATFSNITMEAMGFTNVNFGDDEMFVRAPEPDNIAKVSGGLEENNDKFGK